MFCIKIVSSLLLVLCLSQTTLSQTANYCSSSLCSSGVTHIACGHSGAFADSCPDDVRMVDLTSYKSLIVNSHNDKRNQIASGNLPGFLGAKRMATMQWDDELANLAALNVKQCVMAHDKCRNTDRFRYSGQNLGSFMYSGSVGGFNDFYLIQNRIDAWWSEYVDCTTDYINAYPNNYKGPAIGHFTVMTSERNNYVGCAVARYTKDGWNTFLIACNYAYTNIINAPLYVSGTTASGCTTGTNSVYTGLCASQEQY